jgi:hypothetical protein
MDANVERYCNLGMRNATVERRNKHVISWKNGRETGETYKSCEDIELSLA